MITSKSFDNSEQFCNTDIISVGGWDQLVFYKLLCELYKYKTYYFVRFVCNVWSRHSFDLLLPQARPILFIHIVQSIALVMRMPAFKKVFLEKEI